jgi:hypothetical protein
MLGDSDSNIYFEVRRGRKTETVSRSELLQQDIAAVLHFYEARIRFRRNQ